MGGIIGKGAGYDKVRNVEQSSKDGKNLWFLRRVLQRSPKVEVPPVECLPLEVPTIECLPCFEGRRTTAVPLGPRGNEDCGGLLPGIPNEITLSLIAPKLSWRDVRSLSSVNSAWWHAIRSREVYDARVRLHSTETLVLLIYRPYEFGGAIGLYSLRENRFYQLPSIPQLDGRMPYSSQCVSLDGKIYVLGGEVWPARNNGRNMYVLDLAGQRQWKQCASMIQPRGNFGCGVLNGKLYVFGGMVSGGIVCGSEVYDPEEDTWSPIKAMIDLRFDHNVATLGAKLLVHGGNVLEPKEYYRFLGKKEHCASNNYLRNNYLRNDFPWGNLMYTFQGTQFTARPVVSHKSFLVYDAVKDEWSMLEAGRRQLRDISFMRQGKLHSLGRQDIHVLDLERNSWTLLHSFSFALCGHRGVNVQSVLAAGDHLLATVDTNVESTGRSGRVRERCLLRSRGLGSTNEQIEWERIRLPFPFEETALGLGFTPFSNCFMHQIQL